MNTPIDISNVLPFLLSLPAAGASVVILAQIIKKLFGMNSGKAIHAMVVLVSITTSVAAYVLKFKGLPPEVIGVSGPAVYGFSQGLYKTAIYASDYLPKLSNLLYKVSSMFSKAPASIPAADAQVNSVSVPAHAASETASAPEEFSL